VQKLLQRFLHISATSQTSQKSAPPGYLSVAVSFAFASADPFAEVNPVPCRYCLGKNCSNQPSCVPSIASTSSNAQAAGEQLAGTEDPKRTGGGLYLAIWGEQVDFGEDVEVGQLQENHGRHGLQTAGHKFADFRNKL
jgi:hypothetical protein